MNRHSSLLRQLPIAAVAFCFANWLGCNTLPDASLTGGSGAGNPGGTISVALSITTDSALAPSALAKTAVTGQFDNGIIDPARPVVVADMAGLAVTVTGVQINSADFRLVLDEREDSRRILDSLKERPWFVTSDSQSLVINKAFSFDCLNGVPDSTIPPVIMPVAWYTGVMLHFNQNIPALPDTALRSQILITGSFVYNSHIHPLRIEINRTFSPFYKFADGLGLFTLSKTDTTNLEIRFNARQWFRNVNFKQCLDQGILSFTADGGLVISSCTSRYGVIEIESRIRMDFINSGRLVVF